jgi:hypothetical protein
MKMMAPPSGFRVPHYNAIVYANSAIISGMSAEAE